MYNCAIDTFNSTNFNQSLAKGRPSYFRDHKANYFVTFGDKLDYIGLTFKEQNEWEKETSKIKTESIIKKEKAYFNMSFALSTMITCIGSFALYYTIF